MVRAAGPLYGNRAGEGRHKDRAQVGPYLLPQPHPAQSPGSGTQRPTHPPATLRPLPSPLPSKSPLKAPTSCPALSLCLLLCQLPSLPKHLTFSFPFSTSPHPRRSKAPFCPQASPRNKDECEWTGTGHHLDHPSHPIKFHPALNLCTTLLSGLRVELRCWYGHILHLLPTTPTPAHSAGGLMAGAGHSAWQMGLLLHLPGLRQRLPASQKGPREAERSPGCQLLS